MSKCAGVQMMNRFLVLILLIGLVGCTRSNSKKTPVEPHKKTLQQADPVAEYIGVVKINGVINFRDKLKNVRLKLGESESSGIEESDQKDDNGNFSKNIFYYTFKGISFQSYNDTLITLTGVNLVE